MSKRSVAVQIAGQEYRIRSDADEDALHRLAGYVDRAMGRVRERTGTVDSQIESNVLAEIFINAEGLVQAMRGVENQIDITDQTASVNRTRTGKIIEGTEKTTCRKCPIVKVDRT